MGPLSDSSTPAIAGLGAVLIRPLGLAIGHYGTFLKSFCDNIIHFFNAEQSSDCRVFAKQGMLKVAHSGPLSKGYIFNITIVFYFHDLNSLEQL